MLELKSPNKLRALTGITIEKLEARATQVDRQYKSFDSRMGTGKWRHIDNPRKDLKSVQGKILREVLSLVPLPRRMYGARRGGSILNHADEHTGQECILTLDLKDCYPRTSNRQVFDVFMQRFGCSPRIAHVLTRLCTLNFRLPQGAPTSGYLAHLALLDLFAELDAIAKARRLRLSFYVDDIAISGRRPAVLAVVGTVTTAIKKHGHSVRNAKKVIMVDDDRMITNLKIEDRVRVPTSYIEELEAQLIEGARGGTVTLDKYNSLKGKVAWVRTAGNAQAEPLEELFSFIDAGTRRTKTFPENWPCTGKDTCRWWSQNREQYRRASSLAQPETQDSSCS